MEFKVIPSFPGYKISREGIILGRNNIHKKPFKDKVYKLIDSNGKQNYKHIDELIRETWRLTEVKQKQYIKNVLNLEELMDNKKEILEILKNDWCNNTKDKFKKGDWYNLIECYLEFKNFGLENSGIYTDPDEFMIKFLKSTPSKSAVHVALSYRMSWYEIYAKEYNSYNKHLIRRMIRTLQELVLPKIEYVEVIKDV